MAPVKFDDISKTAKDILEDDYQTSGFEFVTKQKTNVSASVATTTVTMFPPTAKVGWKIPQPFGLKGFSVDKLEMDKAGKFKIETSMDKGLHSVDGLKVEAKSGLEDLSKMTADLTYTGIADTSIKVNAPVLAPDKFTLDVTRSLQQATVGVKCGMANMSSPDIGARFATGPLFASLLLKDKFKTIAAHASYKASDDLKVAATCVQGKDLKGSVGVAYTVSKDTTVKAKVAEDTSVTASVKHSVQKGFTVVAGGKFETSSGKLTYGMKLTVE
jgi:hypothetical protein